MRFRSGIGRGLSHAPRSNYRPVRHVPFMHAFLVSTGVVALAEMGDKTQLLALVLAARFGRPVPIALGILIATLANHAVAAGIGMIAGDWLAGFWFRIGLALSFVALGLWSLVPDKLDDPAVDDRRWGAFATTLVVFFLVEIGDKTQVATVALAAEYQSLAAVVAGTTLGMMLANLPVVWLGQVFAGRLPLKALRFGAALVFMAIGALLLFKTLNP